MYFADRHLTAAALAADRVKQIEEKHPNGVDSLEEVENIPPNVEHSALVGSCVIGSFAYVEGAVNEAYEEMRHEEVRRILSISEELTSNNFTKYSTLSKYQALLMTANREPFNKGEAPFQEIAWVNKLRNYLIHYEPDTINSETSPKSEESNLESALRDRMDPNPLFSDTDERFLPRLGLSYQCCEWSILSALEFVHEFRTKMDNEWTSKFPIAITSILDLDPGFIQSK